MRALGQLSSTEMDDRQDDRSDTQITDQKHHIDVHVKQLRGTIVILSLKDLFLSITFS